MDKLTWEVWTVTFGLFIGLVSYLIKKYVEWKVDLVLRGKLEVIKKLHIERFDAVVHIKGMLAEIDHCIYHISNGDTEEYVERCNEWTKKVRKESRSLIAIVSSDYVKAIREGTDVATEYSNVQNKNLYEDWKRHYAHLEVIGTNVQRSLD